MAFKIKENEIAYVKATDEPVFIVSLAENDGTKHGTAYVRRVTTTVGSALQYGDDAFSIPELHSAESRLVSELDFTKFSLKQREKYSKEYQASQDARVPNAKLPISIPQADGSSLLN